MKALEFETLPEKNTIKIPENFENINGKKVKIIILYEEFLNSTVSEEEKKDTFTNIEDLELKTEFATFLYSKNKFTLEQGAKYAGIDILSFQKELGKRKIPMHYSISDLEDDFETIKTLG